jgi:hypothetical protein
MRHFKDCHLARMSDGHFCIIRDLGPVKGGKGPGCVKTLISKRCAELFSPLPSRNRGCQYN